MSDDVMVRVTGGSPTEEEIAALVAVLLSRGGGVPAAPGPVVSRWRLSARPYAGPRAGRGNWRAAALPVPTR